MPEADAEPVVVARIGGAYGVSGWVHIASFTEPPANIRRYRPWLLVQKAPMARDSAREWREVEVQALDAHGDGFIARLAGVSSREQAQALAGTLIAVPASCLPALDDEHEYYWRDLVGCVVADSAQRELGTVDHLLETGAHDVLVIRGADGELMIPFLRQFVIQVDLRERRLVVDWQEPD